MEPFSRPCVEFRGDAIAVVLRQVVHALALGKVLADQAVGVLVGPAFPRAVARREIKPGVGRAFDGGVAVELRPVVRRDRPHGASLASNQLGRAVVHVRRGAGVELPDGHVAGFPLDQGARTRAASGGASGAANTAG